jgi:cell division protein FtsW
LLIFSRIDHRRWERWAPFIMGAAIFLMLMVFVPGLAANYGTARSWIMVAGRFSFQPTEFLKLATIIYLAALFSSKERTARQAFGPAVGVFALSAFLLMLQPDFGSLVLIAAVFMIMICAAGVPFTYLASTMLIGAAAFWVFARSASYRVARLMVFLHPELDPQGIGYQTNQALLAIGSGGLFGLGLGHSLQKYQYLPQVMDDSIFPIIAEELGFFFSLGLVVLVAAIFFRGLRIARGSRDDFGRLFTVGMISWLAVQSFLNIGAMLGLLPLTGLPLPLVSYGGSAMTVTLWGVGIVLSISRGTERTNI